MEAHGFIKVLLLMALYTCLGFWVIRAHSVCAIPEERLDLWFVGHDGPGIPAVFTPWVFVDFFKCLYRYPAKIVLFYYPGICKPLGIPKAPRVRPI